MMEAFRFLLISLLSLTLFNVEGVTAQSDFTIMIKGKENNISETLPVSIVSSGGDPLPDLCLQVLVDKKGVQPTWPDQDQPGLEFLPRNSDRFKSREVTFDCSGTALFDSPVNVIASIFSATPHECETELDQDQLLGNDTALLYDDRVSIEWSPHPEDCYVNQSCSFSAKIGRVSHSLNGPLNVTANITQTSQTIISPINFGSADVVNLVHTFHQVGTLTAVLSVPNELRRNVYWKQQLLEINVKTNMVLKLQNEMDHLRLQVIHLESLASNLTEVVLNLTEVVQGLQALPCQLQECGEYSTCVDGHCECTLPLVYNGSKCTNFVGCVNSPEACGRGRYGNCLEPANPFNRLYNCSCFDEINVSGDDCENCSNETFCSGHGNCTVNRTGQATCECDTDFAGPNCENCIKDCGHGDCIIDDETDSPTCECDTDHRSVESGCKECEEGWTGGTCDLRECDKANANVTFCKDSRSTCVYNSSDSKEKVCYCDDGSLVASNEICTDPPPPNLCDPPCGNGRVCSPNKAGNGHVCECPLGKNCEVEEESVTSPTTVLNQSDNNSQLLYGGLAVFIAALVVSVAAYLAYHNREKILELFGGKKESVVEMAMRSRRKAKGYKKLPTSIHDTLTHED